MVPSAERQAGVMSAIYGPQGAKAGFTAGTCVDDLLAAIDALAASGVEVVILGCTELPLLLPHASVTTSQGRVVMLIDPTDVLARHCVTRALAHPSPSHSNASLQTT